MQPASDNIQQRKPKDSNAESGDDVSQEIPILGQTVASTVGAYVFSTGKQKAQQALNIYSHIDYLRPYFDVEPKDVLNRLIYSLVPVDRRANMNALFTELYGPLMIIFTLCAILIYQMKVASHSIVNSLIKSVVYKKFFEFK
jgi:hypothetical protein